MLEEAPLDFQGLDCITCFCPTSAEFLNLLKSFDLRHARGATAPHLMAECMLTAFTDTIRWYGDPDFEDAPVTALMSAEFAGRRARVIDPARAMPRPPRPASTDDLAVGSAHALPESGPWAPKLGGTTQVAVCDGAGNMAAVCISLSDAHGSLVYCPGTGVVLNNGMQNFDPRPGRPNSIKPGKMPIFAAPVLVATRQGEPVFAAAGSGGYRILTGSCTPLSTGPFMTWTLKQAIEAPRIHCQSRETFVDERFPDAIIEELAAMGHDIRLQRDAPGLNAFARVAAVTRDPAKGLITGASWPPWINDNGRHLKETCTTGKPATCRPFADPAQVRNTVLIAAWFAGYPASRRRPAIAYAEVLEQNRSRMPPSARTDFCRSCDILSPQTPQRGCREVRFGDWVHPGSGVIPPSLGSTA